jgi:hypothetical protein
LSQYDIVNWLVTKEKNTKEINHVYPSQPVKSNHIYLGVANKIWEVISSQHSGLHVTKTCKICSEAYAIQK